jgi:co-chaperonin GroES (HSP10)
MAPRMIKSEHAEYDPAPDFPGYNPSGLQPLGPNVLVRTDTCAAHTGGGLILLTDEMRWRMDAASVTGVIYAMGKTAWSGYVADEHPQVGDRVVFAKWSGEVPQATADGAPYRLMDDSCVLARQIAPGGPAIGEDA